MVYSSLLKRYETKKPVNLDYLIKFERQKKDFTNRIPDKQPQLERLPWGFYGYTYIGERKQIWNELLPYVPDKKEETDLHECIHTPDEYETRRLTEEMMDIDEEKLIKELSDYKTNLTCLLTNEESRKESREYISFN